MEGGFGGRGVWAGGLPVSIGLHGMNELGLQALDGATQVGEFSILGSSCQGVAPLLPPHPLLTLHP